MSGPRLWGWVGLVVLLGASLVWVWMPGNPSFSDNLGDPDTSVVVMYLHDGTEATGTLEKVDSKHYWLKTDQGVQKIKRDQYQGMVLNTPQEQKIAQRISTDMIVYMTAARYTYDFRQRLTPVLQASASSDCKLKTLPLAHFQIQRDGTPKKVTLLSESNCPEVDQALVQAIQSVEPTPLPSDIPFAPFPMNYLYDPSQKTANPAPAE